MTLYEITQVLINAINNLEVDEDGCYTNIEELDKVSMDFDAKAINVALMVKNLVAEAEGIKAEKIQLAKRQKVAENNAEGLKKYLDKMLKAAGKTEVKDARAALSYRKSTSAKLDLTQLGKEWLKEMDATKEDNYRKADITKALKEGKVIPGAALETNYNLQIK